MDNDEIPHEIAHYQHLRMAALDFATRSSWLYKNEQQLMELTKKFYAYIEMGFDF